jgi:hypothetical protein
MNRKERRRAGKMSRGTAINVTMGRIVMNGLDDAVDVTCDVCRNPAPAWEWKGGLAHGVAKLESTEGTGMFIVCRSCFENSDDTEEKLVCRHLNAPGLEFTNASPEQQALYDQTMATPPSAKRH